MNREIKFRIYFNEMKCFSYFDLHDFIDLCDGYAGTRKENFTLQQFTGLKDKNGKEIYEGDILEGKPPIQFDHVKREMEENNYSFWERGIVKYYPELARFGLSFYSEEGGEGYTGTTQHIHKFVNDGDVVIGNIFENEDLLR